MKQRTQAASIARGSLLRGLLMASLVPAFLLIGIGCKVDQNANKHYGCKSKGDCKSGQECYRGFCVSDGSSGSGGKSGSGGTGTGTGGTSGTGDEDGGPHGDAAMPGDGGEVDAAVDASVEVPDDKLGTNCEGDDTESCYLAKDKKTAVIGVCKAGIRTCDCEGGAQMCDQRVWGNCFSQILPSPEMCDGLDDDCDNKVDEDVVAGGSCAVEGAKGVCAEGTESCESGALVCNQVAVAGAETCNALDDDCDGMVDEDTERACYPDATEGCTQASDGTFSCKGVCAPGTQTCDPATGTYTMCDKPTTPTEEACGTPGPAVNEDCDDATDEACTCVDGVISDCYDGNVGAAMNLPCKFGKQTCTGTSLGPCEDQVLPGVETCANDGVDDDCNGSPDDVVGRNGSCSKPSNKGLCRDGVLDCVGNALTCVTAEPVDEICDGLDNDCNGVVDNGFNLQTDPNNCGRCGTMCDGGTVCCAGHCVNTQTDANYCGRCENARCGAGGICCSGKCKNSNSDALNCKTCGTDCTLLGLLGACCSGTCKTLGCGGG